MKIALIPEILTPTEVGSVGAHQHHCMILLFLLQVLPVENKMRHPEAFPSMFGVLNLGMVVVCVLYITTGFYGYIEFGNDCKGSVTLNLKSW